MLPQTAYATAGAVFVAGLLEGVGVPWPGAFVVAGAAAGMGGGLTDIPLVALLFTAGYCLGSAIQYCLGRVLGPVVLGWLPAAQRSRLDALTAKHGMTIVLWTRPLAAGNYVSIPAGMMRMPVLRFVLYTFLGIAPWAGAIALGGRALGSRVAAVSDSAAQWLLPATLVLVGWWALRRLGTALWRRYREGIDAAI